MNLKKISAYWLVFSLIGIFFYTSAHAEKPVVTAKTNSVTPLRVTLEPSSKERIQVNVTGTYTKKDIEDIVFTIDGDFDNDGRLDRQQFRHQWNERYREDGDVFLSVRFDFAYIGLAENFRFTTEFWNAERKRLASGTQKVRINKTIR